MKHLLPVALTVILTGCSTVSPIYEFYAHRHALPMLGKEYMAIPAEGPSRQELHNASYAKVQDQALSLLEQHRQTINSPGISAAVAIDGELVWAGVSGWSDIAANKPLTTTSQFRIGSTSKALTATLLARMVDAGQITLDTPLADFKVSQAKEDWQAITPRQLASHTAGIPHYDANGDWRGMVRIMSLDTHYDDVVESVALFDGSDTLFAPGDKFEYSSLGTVLLSAVMQEAGANTYQVMMEREVLAPLGMTHTGPEPAIGSRAKQAPELATFYWHPNPAEPRVSEWRPVDLSHRLAGGGFVSTSSDLVRLGIGFNSPEFISDETRVVFWTPQVLNNGEVNEQGYALGWRVRESDFGDGLGMLMHANHGGVSRGAQSWLMVIPAYDMAVAVNINAKTGEFWDFAGVSYELVKTFLHERRNLEEGGVIAKR